MAPGEVVVIDGTDKLREGAKVEVDGGRGAAARVRRRGRASRLRNRMPESRVAGAKAPLRRPPAAN